MEIQANSYLPPYPRPPAALPARLLHLPDQGERVVVAGLVLVRQRPGTAKGVIFLTLEDETGVINVVVWKKIYLAFRRAVIAGRLLRVTGPIQRDGDVVHVIAQTVEDISDMLDRLADGRTAPMGEPVNTYDARGVR
ncbi:MAG: OB-fold nucleic acid binding domain-containing protein [Pseudomonadota bacterium]